MNIVNCDGGAPKVWGFRFATDGSGDETLEHDYRGTVSIAKSSNTYTITLPPWAVTLACVVVHDDPAETVATTVDKAAGTIALAFSGAFTSQNCDVALLTLGSDA